MIDEQLRAWVDMVATENPGFHGEVGVGNLARFAQRPPFVE
jgi:hypothetical protein